MSRLAAAAARRPLLWLALIAAATAVFGVGLARLELDTDGARLYPADDPAVETWERDRERFGDGDPLLVLVSARPGGPAVASPAGLAELARIEALLARLPEVEGASVRSVASLPELLIGEGGFEIRQVGDHLPEAPGEFTRRLEQIREDPLVSGLFLAENGRAAVLWAHLAPGVTDRRQAIRRIEERLTAEPSPFEVRLTGPAPAEAALGDRVLADLAYRVPVLVVVLAAGLVWALRAPGPVLAGMAEVAVVLVWTLGAMGWAGVPVTLVTTVLPVVVLSMALADEIHLLERFGRRLTAGGGSAADLRQALLGAVAQVRRPVVLTSLTTAAGFLSFVAAPIEPLVHFGLFAAWGLTAAMILTFTLIPALAVVVPASWWLPRRAPGRRDLSTLGRFVVRREGRAFTLALLVVLPLAAGWPRLSVQDSWVENFSADTPLVEAERRINRDFWGTYRADVVLEGPAPGYFFRHEGLRLLEEARRRAAAAPETGGTVSLLDAYASVARAHRVEGPMSALPAEELARLTAWVRAGAVRGRLWELAAPDGSAVRLRVLVESADYERGQALTSYLEREMASLTAGSPVEMHLSGDVPVALAVVGAIVRSQLRSVALTVAVVGLLLALVWRSFRRAAVALAPSLVAAGAILGAMGWLGWPLGIASSMFTALTIGVGVDFAVHFQERYHRVRTEGSDHPRAVRDTLAATGPALRANALVLAAGLAVLVTSSLPPNRALGILLAAALLSCWAATLLLTPRMLRGAVSRPPLGTYR